MAAAVVSSYVHFLPPELFISCPRPVSPLFLARSCSHPSPGLAGRSLQDHFSRETPGRHASRPRSLGTAGSRGRARRWAQRARGGHGPARPRCPGDLGRLEVWFRTTPPGPRPGQAFGSPLVASITGRACGCVVGRACDRLKVIMGCPVMSCRGLSIRCLGSAKGPRTQSRVGLKDLSQVWTPAPGQKVSLEHLLTDKNGFTPAPHDWAERICSALTPREDSCAPKSRLAEIP